MKTHTPLRSVLKGMCAVLFFTGSAAAAPVLGDYDNDGQSDLSIAQVDRSAGTTSWTTRLSSGAPNLSWSFNVPGDALVTGKFFGDGKTYPGIVNVSDSNRPLDWYVKNPAGGEVSFHFCRPGDDIFNLADIDGDGVTDIACSRRSGRINGFRSWYFAVSSVPGAVAEEVFGLDSDRVAMAYMDNSGRASMVALRAGFTWFTKKVWEPVVTQQQWGLPGDIPILPQDLNNSGQAAYIIVRPSSVTRDQTAYIRYPDGSVAISRLGLQTAVPVVGKFFTDPGFAWFQRDAGLVGVRQPDGNDMVFAFGNRSSIIVRPDGTVVQPGDSNRFGDNSSNDSGNGYVCSQRLKLPDGSANNKVNAMNSRKVLKLIIRSEFAGKIDAIKAFVDGSLFDSFTNMGFEYGNRPWWNSRKSITSYSASKPVTAVLYLNNGTQACLFIDNPRVTTD